MGPGVVRDEVAGGRKLASLGHGSARPVRRRFLCVRARLDRELQSFTKG